MEFYQNHPHKKRRIGFISTRFEGTDGVSLETEKWVKILEQLNCVCFFLAGACEWPEERSKIVPEIHFKFPDIQNINDIAFTKRVRPPEITQRIANIKDFIKGHIYQFILSFNLDIIIIENAFAIPMNIPLGIALTEIIAETGIPTIAHHHDFFWERKRFLVNCVWDYFNMAFPPHLPPIRHVVINSSAANQLSLRTGISSYLIPNVMDFDHPPEKPDDYTKDVRQALMVQEDELFFLQPTRVVPRKGIEHAIDLTRRIGMKARLVISHASGDEGYEYEQYLHEYARLNDVSINFVNEIIRQKRDIIDGRKIYTLTDVYPYADLVTYPSDIEGFGNAFLEAIYFRRPIIVNNYSIFYIVIKHKGFRVIEFDGYIADHTVENTRKILNNPDLTEEMIEHNYQIARRHYSYSVLERRLHALLADCFGEEG